MRDPELVDSGKGFEKPMMRLQLGDAFDNATLLHPPERTKQGGKRANAGRKPKCATCPPGTAIQETTSTTVQHICTGCGDVLSEETSVTKRVLQPGQINQVEIGEAPTDAPSKELAPEEINQVETGETPEPPMFEMEEAMLFTPISNIPVPPIIEETIDLVAAIKCAEAYCPPEDKGRREYKTAMFCLAQQDLVRADKFIQGIKEPQARAIAEHLAARAQLQGVT